MLTYEEFIRKNEDTKNFHANKAALYRVIEVTIEGDIISAKVQQVTNKEGTCKDIPTILDCVQRGAVAFTNPSKLKPYIEHIEKENQVGAKAAAKAIAYVHATYLNTDDYFVDVLKTHASKYPVDNYMCSEVFYKGEQVTRTFVKIKGIPITKQRISKVNRDESMTAFGRELVLRECRHLSAQEMVQALKKHGVTKRECLALHLDRAVVDYIYGTKKK